MLQLIDFLLGLPTAVIVFTMLGIWGTVAFVIHRIVVPRLCGPDGKGLGRFEAEVTSQIALAFGLLISFNAVWLWDRGERVRSAVHDEAAALESILDETDTAPTRAEFRSAIAAYARHAIEVEWPALRKSAASGDRPAELLALRTLARSSGGDDLRDAYRLVDTSREVRVRDGQAMMPRSRWTIVFALAILTLLSIGALHGDSPRGRALALTLVTLAISCCFIVLMVNGRPFIGEFAIQPTDLERVLQRAAAAPSGE